ncbi:MAG: tetratricopeptide repeat protein [Emcibacteraceae bacterium]|nr:tetratricopeptide repeat protein [Emcibacteraceae bacterium]MDG1858349.1 tetratricopeptide repeat protein [Emcibacteraceae bacterium]
MCEKFTNSLKSIVTVVLTSLLFACGGGGAFEPVYDDNTPQSSDRRVDGEMPFSSPSLMKMADSFRQANDYPNAIRLYQRAATESPRHITSRLALAQIYQQLGAMDGAAVYFGEVLALEPDHTEAQLGMGNVMVMDNRPMEAVGYLEEVAGKSPENFRIYNSIGLAYDLQGLHGQAQEAYGTGLNIRPNHVSLINNLALSLAIEGEYAPAIILLGKAVNADFSQTTAQQNLIMVYGMSGDERAARTMAGSFMTPVEIEESILHYRWLKSLSSERRAQAIFLNLKSFPEDEVARTMPSTGQVGPNTVVQLPVPNDDLIVEEIDPKKLMLLDILQAEESKLVEKDNPRIVATESEEIVGHVLPQELIDSEEMIPADAIGDMPTGQFKLQIGTYPAVDQLIIEWEGLKALAPDMLMQAAIDVENVETADNSDSYRLYINEYDNYSAAQDFCTRLQNKTVPCLVTKIEN